MTPAAEVATSPTSGDAPGLDPAAGDATGEASGGEIGGGTASRLRLVALIGAVFLVAACGLVYELALIALGSYLIGDSIRQTSVVLSVMVFAMGIGSLAARRAVRSPLVAFAVIELGLALVGGLSVLVLYASFAWLHFYMPTLVLCAFVIGLLIGAELPLLAALFERLRQQGTGKTVAELFAVDYIGALLGGLAFPFVLLPTTGLLTGTMAVGALNALCAVVLVRAAFGDQLTRRQRFSVGGAGAAVLVVLALAAWFADDFEVTARQAIFRDPIVRAERSPYQEIVVTEAQVGGRAGDVRLFLNGNLQFSSLDEHRYHELLVHPAMDGPHERVLILGGGDGLAAREVLRYPGVESVTLVELDPTMIDLARTDERFTRLNGGSLDDPRVEVVTTDAFTWLRGEHPEFDVVLIDFPDPDTPGTAKLYSQEFYGMLDSALRPDGRIAVQSSSPFYAPLVFWDIDLTMRAAGWATTPYHADVPTFGDWGFVLARRGTSPEVRLAPDAPPLRFLDDAVLAASLVFPPDQRPTEDLVPSTLLHPSILDYQQRSWTTY